MKKSYSALIVILFLSLFYFSCNKDNPVSPGSSPTTPVTNRYIRNVNKSIPAVDTLSIADNGAMVSLSFALDTILAIDGTQKLDVVLMHNNISDTLIKSFTNPSFPSYNFKGCICTDSAAAYFQPGLPEYTGTYKPYKPLSVFNGAPLNGPWYLIFSYPALNKTGVIKSWSITITYHAEYTTGSHIVPLAVGNYWTFAIDTGSISNVTQATVNIIGQDTVHNKQVYLWQWQGSNYYWYVRDENDGLWWYGFVSASSTDTTTSPFLWMKYPINLNERYITRQWVSNYDTITCTGTNVTFFGHSGSVKYSETSNMKLEAYNPLYKFINPDFNKGTNLYFSGDFYFVPNVGYVGNEVTTRTSTTNNFQRYRLTSYHVQ